MDINELLREDRDIIFMVEILFKETEEGTLSQTDKYLEFREKDGDEWVFHSLTGHLESGTCTISAADGENHKVKLHMHSCDFCVFSRIVFVLNFVQHL